MELFHLRLEEINQALIQNRLIDETRKLTLDLTTIATNDPVELLRLDKGLHSLRVIAFNDGELSVALLAFSEARQRHPSTFLALVTTMHGEAWTREILEGFGGKSTPALAYIWSTLPECIDDKHGVFDSINGPKAVNSLIHVFAALEP